MICRLTVYSRLVFSSSDKLSRRPRKAVFSGQPWARVKERDTDRKTEVAAYAVIYLVLYLWKVMVKVSQDIHPFNSSSSKSNTAYTVKLLSISQMSPGPWGSTQCECECVCVCVWTGPTRTPKSSAGSLTRCNIWEVCVKRDVDTYFICFAFL